VSYVKDAFHDGDRIYITADHILMKGHTGTIDKWVHDMVYIVTMDGGRSIVLKDNEMQNITGCEEKVEYKCIYRPGCDPHEGGMN
jgi:hypothetical protein